MAKNIFELGPRSMMLAPTSIELIRKFSPKLKQPAIMVGAGSSPNRAGVIKMRCLITLISKRRLYKPMCCAHQLSIFDHHFAAMLVTMVLCSMFRV